MTLETTSLAKLCHERLVEFEKETCDHPLLKSWSLESQKHQNWLLGIVDVLLDQPDLTPKQAHENWVAIMKADGWDHGWEFDLYNRRCPYITSYNNIPPYAWAVNDIIYGTIRSEMGLPYVSSVPPISEQPKWLTSGTPVIPSHRVVKSPRVASRSQGRVFDYYLQPEPGVTARKHAYRVWLATRQIIHKNHPKTVPTWMALDESIKDRLTALTERIWSSQSVPGEDVVFEMTLQGTQMVHYVSRYQDLPEEHRALINLLRLRYIPV